MTRPRNALYRVDNRLFVAIDGAFHRLNDDHSLNTLLALSLREIRESFERAGPRVDVDGRAAQAPIENQEVWGAGVTYERSRQARAEEAVDADPYERVYSASRPEIFFKSTANRVRGPGQQIVIRADSSWNVPEPELAVIFNSRMEIVGYTIGNDVSSRSIEGENPLYLPQAKLYDGSCALGPVIVPSWEFDPASRSISLEIVRGATRVFSGETSTAAMRRGVGELAEYLGRSQRFPYGCILLTGTGIVPPGDFTLEAGDLTVIRIEGIGELTNLVAVA